MELRTRIALAALASLALLACTRDPAPQRESAPGTIEAPTERIRVEVLNATKVHGLARRATEYLRDRGFDVVASGTAREQRDSTLIIDRTNHPVWAGRAARAFNGARVELARDSSRYVDLTVLVGAAWRPPAEPFYP
ncbi:MAG TPA: LytR C-terminal domain-containing protein [Gemmatimonadaceae bacterium]|nr:LytR C-terminal domain-containing protein [Gemmatimonadaceae bacterium]